MFSWDLQCWSCIWHMKKLKGVVDNSEDWPNRTQGSDQNLSGFWNLRVMQLLKFPEVLFPWGDSQDSPLKVHSSLPHHKLWEWRLQSLKSLPFIDTLASSNVYHEKAMQQTVSQFQYLSTDAAHPLFCCQLLNRCRFTYSGCTQEGSCT